MESDKRFAHIASDPKFRPIPKGERKVKIDKRFKSMFTDKAFKVKYTTDKRGRPVQHSTTEDLKRYYDLDSDEEDSSDESDEESVENEEQSEEEQDEGDKELAKVEKTDKKVSDKVKKKLKNLTVDYARGEGKLLSDSSSDDEQTDEEEEAKVEAQGIDHKWGELDADAATTNDATYRLAACNMDWDRIRAVDLMVLFNSFLPPGGSITSVDIYPSEYGKKRMAEEEVKGPMELVTKTKREIPENEDEEQEEGSKYHMEKLRQYQLNRLKYYYAVITCNGPGAANKIYGECDGMEYESSATKIDLRFIPDDLSFDGDKPKESCLQLPEVNKYKPRFFTTTALQQAKVDLTWDETNPDRLEMNEKLSKGKIDDITDLDLKNYLASSSDSDSEDDDKDSESEEGEEKAKNPIDKYKALLLEIEDKEKAKANKDIGMEITWGVDLQKKTDQLIKDKVAGKDDMTPFEQFLDKRKEKRKEKRIAKKQGEEKDEDVPSDVDMNDSYFAEEFDKPEFKKSKSKKPNEDSDSSVDSEEEAENIAQLELLLDGEDNKKHFSLKKIQDAENNEGKKKRKKQRNKKVDNEDGDKDKDEFQVNVNDERFSALFTSHHYNIDPTDPHFKKTKNMDKLINEKIKRRIAQDDSNSKGQGTSFAPASKKMKMKKKNAELNVLVKSVKRKAEAFKNKNKKK